MKRDFRFKTLPIFLVVLLLLPLITEAAICVGKSTKLIYHNIRWHVSALSLLILLASLRKLEFSRFQYIVLLTSAIINLGFWQTSYAYKASHDFPYMVVYTCIVCLCLIVNARWITKKATRWVARISVCFLSTGLLLVTVFQHTTGTSCELFSPGSKYVAYTDSVSFVWEHTYTDVYQVISVSPIGTICCGPVLQYDLAGFYGSAALEVYWTDDDAICICGETLLLSGQ